MSRPVAAAIALLERVQTRLADADAWAQGSFARTRSGLHVLATDADASCWCLMGAVARECTRGDLGEVGRTALGAMEAVLGLDGALAGVTLAGWNDAPDRTHADVCRALRLALEHLRTTEGVAA